MNHSLTELLILANRARWERLGDRFRTDRPAIEATDMIWLGVTALIAVLVVYVLSRATSTANQKRVIHSPRKLFRELSNAHGLDRSQRRLLETIARTQSLPMPAMIFIDPARLADQRLPKELRSRQEIVTLRATLFADGEPEAAGRND